MSIQDWWETAHKSANRRWLTASALSSYLKFFDAEDVYNKAHYILEIGCGTCVATKQMDDVGKNLTVLDISQQALKTASQWATTVHSSEIKLLPANYFDLAISHLVAQHMNDTDLQDQLTYVIKSLMDNGRFLLQFADAKNHPQEFTIRHEERGGMLRRPFQMTGLVENVGGKVIKNIERKINNNVMWYGYHIIKA